MSDANAWGGALIAITLTAQMLLAISLTYATVKNHLRGNIRPVVAVLAVYMWAASVLSFFRLLARLMRVYDLNVDLIVEGWPYLLANALLAVSAFALYYVLSKAYPNSHT